MTDQTNVQKIGDWRAAYPGERITAAVLREVLDRADLRDADLWGADLRDADLRGADLRGADLWGANLRGANLRDANLRDANLRDADLWGADLRDADLRGADLRDADLRDANLRGANLRDANLRGASRITMQLRGIPSGELILFPTPEGWRLYVGCWEGTPDALRELVAGDEWPEARGAEIEKRRPYLEAALTLVDLHITNSPGVIESLAEKWGES